MSFETQGKKLMQCQHKLYDLNCDRCAYKVEISITFMEHISLSSLRNLDFSIIILLNVLPDVFSSAVVEGLDRSRVTEESYLQLFTKRRDSSILCVAVISVCFLLFLPPFALRDFFSTSRPSLRLWWDPGGQLGGQQLWLSGSTRINIEKD